MPPERQDPCKNAFLFRDGSPPRQTNSLVGKPCSALCATSRKNLSSVSRVHSLTETVNLGAMKLLGLISTDHFVYTSAKNFDTNTGKRMHKSAIPLPAFRTVRYSVITHYKIDMGNMSTVFFLFSAGFRILRCAAPPSSIYILTRFCAYRQYMINSHDIKFIYVNNLLGKVYFYSLFCYNVYSIFTLGDFVL